jgi:Protein of unknown function (DUF998)
MTALTTTTDCSPAARVTKSLLGYATVAGPFYVTVSLAQALTRDGFDLRRHAWSLLSNGSLGWIQITNFILTGLMVVAFAVGLSRALTTGRGSTWAPRLIGAFGVSLVGAGAFRADPGAGFPAGTPATTSISWHGMLHFMVGGVGFLCLIAACLLLGSRFARSGEKGWAAFSRVTGVVFLAAFAGIASGSGTPAIILSFVAAVVLVWTWMACTAVKIYRTVR